MYARVGDFGEDKDAAAAIRRDTIAPRVEKGQGVTLDFNGVNLVTQSFIHALISAVLRQRGEEVLGLISFKNCGGSVRGIIETVVQYSLDSPD
ncbi:STAS-like domain-containing protein [Sphingosinithalassobacter sp. LHW66-3]|uniref:STAS-like domain-containing protein n=1 Tax=Sphingosinithalassobacter sp. LHW66-3 TaxID=3424718 RepID=UPI003D6A1A40